MKAVPIVHILLLFFFVCSCSREESILYDYKSLAKELKVNSSEYTEEDWDNVVKKYEKLEKKVTHCGFSQRKEKELNRLRDQCVAYMFKRKVANTNSMTPSEDVDISIFSEGAINIEPIVNTDEDSSVRSVTLLDNPIPTISIDEQILYRRTFVTSYNKETKCPNWVAWHLTREHTDGPYSRKGVPYYDDEGNVYGIGRVTQKTVKNGYFLDMESEKPRQELTEWSSQYNMSHGHMCPAGDNKWDKAAINQSFLLTNMCPQDASLNSGAWNKLEEKCRKWAKKYGDIYIVAGPIFRDKTSRYLGHIAIPDAFFKVILCMSGKPKTIGFIYENSSMSQPMNNQVYTVDEVESITGFDFFPSLPDELENVIESTSNINTW